MITTHEALTNYAESVGDRATAGKIISHCLTLANMVEDAPVSALDQAWFNAAATTMQNKGLAGGTIVTKLSYLRAALQHAVNCKLLSDVPQFRMPAKAGPPREQVVSKEDAIRTITAARELGLDHIALLLHLCFQTARRLESILSLTWKQVDLGKRLIEFGRGVGNKRKGAAPINDTLHQILQGAHQTRQCIYVVHYRGDRIHRNPYTALDRACSFAGVERFTPHICRHSACTWMAEAGIPMRELARLAGMTEATAENVYAKFRPGYLRDAAHVLTF